MTRSTSPARSQKTTATLAGDKGTYDIIETYGFIIGPNAADEKLQPLDDLFAKYADEYKLNEIERVDARGHELRGQALRRCRCRRRCS